jgi:hypothetical protein
MWFPQRIKMRHRYAYGLSKRVYYAHTRRDEAGGLSMG